MINKLLRPVAHLIPESIRWERIWKIAQVDFKKRYYNDKLGVFWALLNPLFQVTIYYFVFTEVMKRAVEGIDNYALFLFAGIIMWQGFKECSKKSMLLLKSKNYLISNIRVKRTDLYLSNALSILFGLLFNILMFIVVAAILGVKFSFYGLWIVPLVFNTLLIGTGFGMLLSVVYIYIKDINHITDIIFLCGFWTSGIFFRADKLLEFFYGFAFINPFLGIIKNTRNALIDSKPPDFQLFFINFLIGIFLYIIGYFLIKKYSYKFHELL